VKRRRALLESNSPRNNRLETHRNDEISPCLKITVVLLLAIASAERSMQIAVAKAERTFVGIFILISAGLG
jgi:hypothetical protein